MIKRLKIRDFKSIRELDLDLDPVTVLVGRSGTGKSTIVQALRFLRNILLDQEQAIQAEGGWERIVPVGENEPKTFMEVVFTLPGEEEDYTYQIAFGRRQKHLGGLHLNAEALLVADKPVFSRSCTEKGWAWETAPQPAAALGHAERPMLGQFPALQQVVFAYAGLSSGIAYYHFPATTLDPRRHTEAPRFSIALPGLAENAANYRDIIRAITQDFQRPGLRKSITASLRAVNPSVVSVELDSLTNPSRAIVGHAAGGKVFELSLDQESDGFRRFYAHLLALYQSPSKLTLIFEEPENAIYPGALSLLADEFKAAPRENRGQVILTTHNPILLDSFDVENVRVVELKEGSTVAGLLSKEQRVAVHDQLLTTGELLTVDRPRLDEELPAETAA